MIENTADELVSFKQTINLVHAAEQLGFVVVAKEGATTVLEHKPGDRIYVSVNSESRDWCFVSKHLSGSIIDLVQHYKGFNLGQTRKFLRAAHGWPDPLERRKASKVVSLRKLDGLAAAKEWQAARVNPKLPFLRHTRMLSEQTLGAPQFVGKFREDARHNAVFPYFAVIEGKWRLVGTEARNRQSGDMARSFCKYTQDAGPGIWISNRPEGGTEAIMYCVITESPLDAMAYHELHDAAHKAASTYLAIRNGAKSDDIVALLKALPGNAKVICAFDNDPAGDRYYKLISELADNVGLACAEYRTAESKDWNDSLIKLRTEENRIKDHTCPF